MKRFTRSRLLAMGVAATMLAGTQAGATQQIGNVGSWEAGSPVDGVVGPAPVSSGRYDWVSTLGGVTGAARIEGFDGSATNGSELVSDAFYAAAGSSVSFYFNYVTSDGAQYADYAFAQLVHADTGAVAANLFTARTRDDGGSTAPGRDLPALEATLTPGAVPIQPGTEWSPLGGSSGSCFSTGCGNTGWILSDYEVQQAGSYQLRFGVSNWLDTSYDSGLAFAGLLLDGNVIGNGSSADRALLPQDLGPNGEFIFDITPTPQQPVFIDPFVSTGYTYSITGDNLITYASFPGSVSIPGLAQQSTGFDIYTLGDILLASNVFDYDFSGQVNGGVTGLKLKGIDTANMLDPTNQTAFVTALTFLNSNSVTVSQAAETTFVAGSVPDPATWMTLALGFGVIGAALRRRRGLAIAA